MARNSKVVGAPIAQIAAQEYFAKPVQALFRAAELEVYDSVKLNIDHPALDLGCGSGAFASVFCRLQGLDRVDFGSDPRASDAQRARRRGVYRMVFLSDARAIPIKTRTIRLVLCNNVLHEITSGERLAILEASRVLASGGQFVMTVATPGFTDRLLPTRLFDRFGLHRLAKLYSRRVNNRAGHRKLKYLGEWLKTLQHVGLEVENCIHYFSGSEATWWSVLNMRPFQVFAILRLLPEFVQRFAVTCIERLIGSVPRPMHPEEKECGYLLIVATKV